MGTKSAKFYEGCREHDTCYSTLGNFRSDCDRGFWTNLKKECDRAFHTWVCQATRGECHLASRGYYEAVVTWGGEPFQRAQEKARPPSDKSEGSDALEIQPSDTTPSTLTNAP